MDVSRADEIKRLALQAMFSDDKLAEVLVLKGGNLLDLVYGISSRASIDLDFSMEDEIAPDEMDAFKAAICRALQETFRASGYEVFDIVFSERPNHLPDSVKSFWGGYQVEFKVIEQPKHKLFSNDMRRLRTGACSIGPGSKKTFKIDVSKHEHCAPKEPREVGGYVIYAYTPAMMVFEKLRAICQQMPEYSQYVENHSPSARARDFFDIHTIMESFRMDLISGGSRELMAKVFASKRVPLQFVGRIPHYREYHRQDFASIAATVRAGVVVQEFDFYFDYVVRRCCTVLEPFWKEEPPSV